MGDECFEQREHHVQASLCTTRALYRRGRRLTAVKVYSICAESAHILVYEVPALNLGAELRNLLALHGRLITLQRVQCSLDTFTETYHAVFSEARIAAIAKKASDALNWYGGSLHVCYAPELESVAETRSKLQQRRRQVAARLRSLRRNAAQGAQKTTEPIGKTSEEIIQHLEENESSVKRRRIKNTIILPPPALPWFLPLSPPLSTEQSSSTIADQRLSLCPAVSTKDSQEADVKTTSSSASLPPSISTVDDFPVPPDPKCVVIKSVPKTPVNRISFRINKKT